MVVSILISIHISDPVTKRFLADNCDPVFGFPTLVRHSWSTATKLIEENAYRVDAEEIIPEDPKAANNTSITLFFKLRSKDKRRLLVGS